MFWSSSRSRTVVPAPKSLSMLFRDFEREILVFSTTTSDGFSWTNKGIKIVGQARTLSRSKEDDMPYTLRDGGRVDFCDDRPRTHVFSIGLGVLMPKYMSEHADESVLHAVVLDSDISLNDTGVGGYRK